MRSHAIVPAVALAMFVGGPAPAGAGIQVDPGASAAFKADAATCLTDFRTADVATKTFVAALESSPHRVHVRERTPGADSRELPGIPIDGRNPCDHGSGRPEDFGRGVGTGSTVEWDFTNTSNLVDGIARQPCAQLLHELYHAYEDASGTMLYKPSPTGLSYKEARATQAENRFRVGKRLPPRTVYGPYALPPDEDPLCETGGTCCDKACVDVTADDTHCGTCGGRCAPSQRCSGGACACSTNACMGECCGSACVDLTSDSSNCGFCGNACPLQSTCENGLCSATCVPCFAPPATSGCCPPDLPYCTIYNGYNAVCCAGDVSRCGCPTGYVGCHNSCVPIGACL